MHTPVTAGQSAPPPFFTFTVLLGFLKKIMATKPVLIKFNGDREVSERSPILEVS